VVRAGFADIQKSEYRVPFSKSLTKEGGEQPKARLKYEFVWAGIVMAISGRQGWANQTARRAGMLVFGVGESLPRGFKEPVDLGERHSGWDLSKRKLLWSVFLTRVATVQTVGI